MHITKWPLLKRMLVQQCDKVKTFASEFPSIEITYGDNQLERQTQDPMFWIRKDSFPCLEELEFKQNDNMKEIWRGQYPGVYFPKLKDIKFLQFQNCSALLPSFSFFFQTLPNLEKLDVSKASFHEIFQCERLRSEGRPTPSRLSELKLSKLNELMHLWKEESDLKSIFYNLRTLEVLECIKLVNLEPSVVSFENLQTLKISKCHGLENLVSYSTAKSLEQLKRMSITDCDLVEEVVKCLEDNVKDGIVYSQLQSLQLRGLPKLSSFCTGKCDLEFPSLKEVIVIGCPQMKCFSLGKTVTKELQNVQWTDDEEKGHWVSDLNSTIQDLYTQKFGCFGSRNLKFSDEFFELIEIWKKSPEQLTLPFKKLQYLEVRNCSSLSYLLTPSMASSLVQLKDLTVKDCAAMEQVITVTSVEEVDLILFPQLESLSLESCSKLSNFYVGSNTLKLPMLEKITIKDCLNMARFASKLASKKEKKTADGRSEETLVKDIFIKAFFCDEATFPSLEWLVVKGNDNIKIQCGHHPEGYFGKLEILHLLGFPKQSAFLPPFFFHSLPNLESLVVKDAFFDEIFQCEEVTGEEKPVCGRTPLRKLRLSKLHELTHLWKEESQLEVDILRNLEFLNVQECSRLKNLVPSTVYFDNLQTLVVSECHGLVDLLRYTTAKSLGQLRRMKVANCDMIEEIVVCSGDAVNDAIVFTQLHRLQLKGLPRLASFCSGDCNFKFPALFQVIVTECPNMQIFSKGELSTPELDEVKLTGDIDEDMDWVIDADVEKDIVDYFHEDDSEDEAVEEKKVEDDRSWEDNLNSTIQQLFKEKSACNCKNGNGENSDHDAKENDGN
ncbi:hypothetical protein SLE2022_132280 [Rubroshorea leprosula]